MKKLVLLACLMSVLPLTGCLSFVHVPRRAIGTFPPGVYTNVSMQVNLPRNRHSWEIGLWPSSGTNLDGFLETQLVAKVTNLSPEALAVGGIVVRWGQTAVVYTGTMDDLARMNFLFDCDTHKHKVKFQLEFEFKPELRLDRAVKLSARGRDML
jgi:hypothetical protein